MIGTHAMLLSQAVAERLGLHATDVEVLDLLGRVGALTAGELADLTGLTSGAVTRLVDRLERAGYVVREANPRDRRSVVVRPVDERLARDVAPLYRPLEEALAGLYARYTEDQIADVLDFIESTNAAVRQHIVRLRGQASDQAHGPNASLGGGPVGRPD